MSEELEVIKLEFLIFPFSLLGFGIVISIIAFVCELLHFRMRSKKTVRIRNTGSKLLEPTLPHSEEIRAPEDLNMD